MTMRNLSIILASFFSTIFLASFITSQSNHEAFVQCLETHSKANISSIIYTPKNSSFPIVLQNYLKNLRFNESITPKPLLILTALDVSHIQAAVICAKAQGLQMKIRSRGHDYEGISYVSEVPFFILDVFNLQSINVNIEEETAWVQTGATLGDIYHRIAEKSNVHAFPAGICPTVGVGGHFSGGGYGILMRKYGLAADNIADAQMVDVNGCILDRASMGEDLFWAVTGGGGSSFGVVISYKVNLVHVPPKVTIFTVNRTTQQNATHLAHRWHEITNKLDHDIFLRMIIDVINVTGLSGTEETIRASFVAFFLGDSENLLSLMNENFPELGLQQQDCIEMSWIESVFYYFNLSRVPQELTYRKVKSDFVKHPMPIEGVEFMFKKMIELKTPILTFNPYGGRMAEISPSAKPFPHRAGNIAMIEYATDWYEGGLEVAEHYINLTRSLYEYMTPFVSKSREAYVNYIDLDLGFNNNGNQSYKEATRYGFKYFKENFNRLVEIKTKFDPDNFFRHEQSIPVFKCGN